MNQVQFYGQQDGERVLYEVHSHKMLETVALIKIIFFGLAIIFLFAVVASAIPEFRTFIVSVGAVLGFTIMVIGWLITKLLGTKSKAFITDRRVIRFSAGSPWTTATRSLTWDEVVKVKTNSPNFWLRSFNIGNVVIHARTTIMQGITDDERPRQEQSVTNDDIMLEGIEYYQDLGNYMDKVLYLYKKEPQELKALRPFVAKPRGQRY